LGDLQKNTHISNFLEIHLVGAKLFHVNRGGEGWTDRQTRWS